MFEDDDSSQDREEKDRSLDLEDSEDGSPFGGRSEHAKSMYTVHRPAKKILQNSKSQKIITPVTGLDKDSLDDDEPATDFSTTITE